MELGLYIVTSFLCIAWAIRMYNCWYLAARLPESDTRRMLLLFLPASFFILFLLVTWPISRTFRFDIFILLFYNSILLVSFILHLVLSRVISGRKAFLASLLVYGLLSVLLAVLVIVVRRVPLFLMRITFYISRFTDFAFIDSVFFSFEPESETDAIISLLHKAVIAFFSYLPIMAVRFLYFRRSQAQLRQELCELRRRVEAMETIVKHE